MKLRTGKEIRFRFGSSEDAADIDDLNEYTKAQVVRNLITHEMGHAVSIGSHCGDSTCVMYQLTINWRRDGHFCITCRGEIYIHNN